MSTSNSNRTQMRDEDVEALLFDFFRSEIPAELKNTTQEGPRAEGSGPRVRSREPSAVPVTKRAGWISLSAVVAALFIAVTALNTSPPTRNLEDRVDQRSGLKSGNVPYVGASPSNAGRAELVSDGASVKEQVFLHPSFMPPEMQKFLPGNLIQEVDPRTGRVTNEFFLPDIELRPDVFGSNANEEDGAPAGNKRRKP